jgi:predicted ATP-grasp superfamily ATP-dependent carboligase
MLYVILDPVADYASYIVEFLDRHDLKAIAVFTDEGKYWGYHHVFEPEIGHCFVDEYLIPQWPDLGALGAQILADWPDQIEGIIPWGELTIEIGAALGEHLGVDWNPREVIHRFRNKYAMKAYLREHGHMRINASRVVTTEDEAVAFQHEVGRWPIVVKPTEGAGSKGVFFVHDEEQLVQGCVEVFHSGDGQVLLEEYVGGNELVVNGIVDAGKNMLVTDVWFYDKRESHGIPNLYYETVKVNTYDPVFWPLAHYAAEVVECLGVKRAPIHMELKIDEFGPCLIEVGARFAGGNQPLMASELHGRSLFELAACHYMDELSLHPDDVRYENYDRRQARIISGIQSYEIPSISAVYGLEEVEQLPSFFMFGNIRPVGSFLPVTRDLYGRSYEVYLIHEDAGQIAYDAEEVRRLLHYV